MAASFPPLLHAKGSRSRGDRRRHHRAAGRTPSADHPALLEPPEAKPVAGSGLVSSQGSPSFRAAQEVCRGGLAGCLLPLILTPMPQGILSTSSSSSGSFQAELLLPHPGEGNASMG